jgi:hypothetical protein
MVISLSSYEFKSHRTTGDKPVKNRMLVLLYLFKLLGAYLCSSALKESSLNRKNIPLLSSHPKEINALLFRKNSLNK